MDCSILELRPLPCGNEGGAGEVDFDVRRQRRLAGVERHRDGDRAGRVVLGRRVVMPRQSGVGRKRRVVVEVRLHGGQDTGVGDDIGRITRRIHQQCRGERQAVVALLCRRRELLAGVERRRHGVVVERRLDRKHRVGELLGNADRGRLGIVELVVHGDAPDRTLERGRDHFVGARAHVAVVRIVQEERDVAAVDRFETERVVGRRRGHADIDNERLFRHLVDGRSVRAQRNRGDTHQGSCRDTREQSTFLHNVVPHFSVVLEQRPPPLEVGQLAYIHEILLIVQVIESQSIDMALL